MRPLLAIGISSHADAERVRRNHHEAIAEIQQAPLVGAVVLPGIELEDGVETPVAHRLGRAPRFVSPSIVRGASSAGFIAEIRAGGYNRAQHLVLKASGWGATITLDLLVVP